MGMNRSIRNTQRLIVEVVFPDKRWKGKVTGLSEYKVVLIANMVLYGCIQWRGLN